MNKTRRLGVVFAALALTMLAVSPALATDLSQDLPDGGLAPADAPDGGTECDTFNEEGMVLWHFLLKDQPSQPVQDPLPTLTATFVDANDVTHEVAGVFTKTSDGTVYHFEVTTPDDYKLTGASTVDDSQGTLVQLLLSHVCIGPPGDDVPEAPFALLLPFMAIAAFGTYLFRSRRQAALGA